MERPSLPFIFLSRRRDHKPSRSIIFCWSNPTTDWPSMIVTGVL
jgi:hypothetical protein